MTYKTLNIWAQVPKTAAEHSRLDVTLLAWEHRQQALKDQSDSMSECGKGLLVKNWANFLEVVPALTEQIHNCLPSSLRRLQFGFEVLEAHGFPFMREVVE